MWPFLVKRGVDANTGDHFDGVPEAQPVWCRYLLSGDPTLSKNKCRPHRRGEYLHFYGSTGYTLQ
jgi:hypothetical protein